MNNKQGESFMKMFLTCVSVLSFVFSFGSNAAIDSWEDCVSYNYKTAQVKKIGNDWKIVDGNHWMFSFGNKVGEASRALQIIKAYKMGHSCFVGRPDPSMEYQLTARSQRAPSGNRLRGEDCIAFNNSNVKVKYFQAQNTYKIVDGNMWMLDFGRNRQEAMLALRAIKKHRFNQQCFVGRPQASFKYWKRNGGSNPNPGRRPDLGAYGFLKIGEQQTLVQWNQTITLKPGDEFLISNGIPAFNLRYSEKNYGQAKGSGYKNAFYLDGKLVSQQTNRSLLPGQKKDVWTQAYLKPSRGVHTLELRIDADNNVAESRENNNRFKIFIRFKGF